jgi:DNA-binding MarR family transcriptional regulator
MQVITTTLDVTKYQYYVRHLEVLNVILPSGNFPDKLSSKEIEVLAAFMCQEKSLIEEDMFNGVVRKKVMEILSLKPGGLGNHLNKIIKKGHLLKNNITKKITLRSFIFPTENNQGYRIKLKKHE